MTQDLHINCDLTVFFYFSFIHLNHITEFIVKLEMCSKRRILKEAKMGTLRGNEGIWADGREPYIEVGGTL